jgi:hypothetical protein
MSTDPSTSEQPGPRFSLGQVVATAAVNEAEDPSDISAAISRHVRGDWGDVDDPQENEANLASGDMLLSSYVLPSTGNQVWVITDADNGGGRTVTTVLYPSEY